MFTVLGNAPAPAGLGVQSSYVVSHNDSYVLVDAGSGVAGKLEQTQLLDKINNIVLSHHHADHVADLPAIGYFFQLIQGKQIDLYVPEPDKLLLFLETIGAKGLWEKTFRIHPYVPGEHISFKDIACQTLPVPHDPQFLTSALKFTYADKQIVLSADCRENRELLQFAKDADLFVCEATLSEYDKSARDVHMDYLQAAKMAAEAEVKELWLTHTAKQYYTKEATEKINDLFVKWKLAGGTWN